MATDTDAGFDSSFEPIDWDELDVGRLAFGWRAWGFLLALGALFALFCYDYFTGYQLTVGAWYTPARLDWLFLLSLVVFVFVVLVPLVTDRERTRQYWRRFRKNRLAVVCAASLVVLLVLAAASVLVLGRPSTYIEYAVQPALFGTIEYGTVAVSCAGKVTGPAVQQYCHGSLQFPFGTNGVGQSVLGLTIAGMGVSLLVALVTSMLMVPIATVRSEEHTSELQSRFDLVCRLLLEKKKH